MLFLLLDHRCTHPLVLQRAPDFPQLFISLNQLVTLVRLLLTNGFDLGEFMIQLSLSCVVDCCNSMSGKRVCILRVALLSCDLLISAKMRGSFIGLSWTMDFFWPYFENETVVTVFPQMYFVNGVPGRLSSSCLIRWPPSNATGLKCANATERQLSA